MKEVESLQQLFGAKIFDFPKPHLTLIKKALKIATIYPDGLVLDFFAGSSPTAHAVLNFNKEDGGNFENLFWFNFPEPCEENSEAKFQKRVQNDCRYREGTDTAGHSQNRGGTKK